MDSADLRNAAHGGGVGVSPRTTTSVPSKRVGLIAITAIISASGRWISPPAYSVLRDWLPAALLLVPYWQVGQFFSSADGAPNIVLQLLITGARCVGICGIPSSNSMYLTRYVMVYPLIPLELVAFTEWFATTCDEYWLVVLPATYPASRLPVCGAAAPPDSWVPYVSHSSARFGTLNREILNRKYPGHYVSAHTLLRPSQRRSSS